VKLTGRILHLADDPALVKRQLDGEDLSEAPEAYAFGVNTDAMISGRACTFGYTPEILGPHFLQDFADVVDHDAVRRGGFQVIVGGDAYGSGSSREVAVVAHEGAGIELVVADSFQRIFQENMVYSGMPFTTDRTVLDQLGAGEDVDVQALADDLPPFFRDVAHAGGLLPYANALLAGEVRPTYDTDRPAGPIDPEISFISVQSSDGRPIALLANYSLHYVGGVRPGDISADYFGYFAKFIEAKMGAADRSPPFVGMLSNGTSGDVNNINFRKRDTRKYDRYEKMQEVAEKIARRVHEAHQKITFHDWVELGTARVDLTLNVRKPTSEVLKHFEKVTRNPNDRSRPQHAREQIYAERITNLQAAPDTVSVQLQAMRIGDVGIAAIPFETFAETGLELKERSPFKETFTIELANGSFGYLPTPGQHRLGGYETWLGTSNVEVEASTKIVSDILNLWQELRPVDAQD